MRDDVEYHVLTDGWVRFVDLKGVPRGYTLTVRAVTDSTGAARCGGYRLEPDDLAQSPPLALPHMRRLPLGHATRLAAQYAGGEKSWPSLAAFLRAATGTLPKRPQGGSDEFSTAVAKVYAEARQSGLPGTQAIQQSWAVGEDTARRWLREARARGVLPPYKPTTPKRKARR